MTETTKYWLQGAYESLIESSACLDCQEGERKGYDTEIIEAVKQDINRACQAIERILKREKAMPKWATDPEEDDYEYIEIPF